MLFIEWHIMSVSPTFVAYTPEFGYVYDICRGF